MAEDFEHEYPDWLEDVAVRVDELAAVSAVLGRFRLMLGTWKVEHDARGPKSLTDKHGHFLYNEVKILPLRNITLAHKYAVLAAIHDVIGDGVKRIDLWRERRRFRFSKAKSGTSYDVLQGRVKELSDRDRSRIEKILREVEADLAALPEDGSSEPSQTHTASPGTSEAADADTMGIPDLPTASTIDTDSGKAEWSEAMSQAEIARRLLRRTTARGRDVKQKLKRYRVKQITDRTFALRLDLMSEEDRKNIQRQFA